MLTAKVYSCIAWRWRISCSEEEKGFCIGKTENFWEAFYVQIFDILQIIEACCSIYIYINRLIFWPQERRITSRQCQTNAAGNTGGQGIGWIYLTLWQTQNSVFRRLLTPNACIYTQKENKKCYYKCYQNLYLNIYKYNIYFIACVCIIGLWYLYDLDVLSHS